MCRLILASVLIFLLCGFTYGYKNNAQTGKPDLVVVGVSASDVSGFSAYSTSHHGFTNVSTVSKSTTPAKWVKIIIGGVSYFIPTWQ